MAEFVSPVPFSSTNSPSVTSVPSVASVAPAACKPSQQTDQNQPKDRPFNGFRGAKSEKARWLITYVVDVVQRFEATYHPRGRPRQPAEQQTFERQVEAIVCDLAHREIMKPSAWLAISFSNSVLGKNDRYRPKVLTQTLPHVVRMMAEPTMQFVDLTEGFHSPFNKAASRQTTIRAGGRLRKLMAHCELGADDFMLDNTEEVIILKAGKEDHSDNGKRMQYEDTPQTIADRENLRRINSWLEHADIEYIPYEAAGTAVDASDRRLRRYFNNGSFEQSGRLFGGFWMNMKRDQREAIAIDGLDTVTLDYGQMAPRMLYGWAGVNPGYTDAYSIPGLEAYRDGVKKIFNAMLHSEKPLGRMPQDTRHLIRNTYSIGDVTEKIKAVHEPIARYFYAGQGLRILHLESTFLITVLTRLIEQGITALPVHDAVIVAVDYADQTTEVLLQVFKELTGIEGIVSADE